MKISNSTDPNLIPFSDAFPNYTIEMWRGNAPCGKGHQYLRSDGTLVDSDRWETRFGGGETVGDRLEYAEFSLNMKVSIYIMGDTLIITDIRYAGKNDFWQYSNDPAYGCIGMVHPLEEERIEEYLSAEVEDCKFWSMIQERAKELYAKGEKK